MSFCIVQTRKSKRALPSLTAVPTNWVQDKSVFWPPSNLVSLSQCKDSVPDKQIWKKQACKLLGKANSYHQAEELISMLDKMTDSEDALQMDRGTRANPAKKRPKFQSKSYQLAPPAPVPGPSGNVIMKQGSSEISSNSKKTHKQPEQLYSEPFESLTI
ncbi:uncharacterized protein LOC134227764 [Armigeres subalbatus]|uniref:uncharacterized protein LOC134227764 n=1 Tax=Armigeres subalbatus TaxID=124917 RepID=UPI002ED238B4